MLESYRGLGITDNKLPKSPQTLEELVQPWADTISNMENTAEPAQSSETVTNAKK
jgi:hypothetical protein